MRAEMTRRAFLRVAAGTGAALITGRLAYGAPAAEAPEAFGCEANPTGDPIGGGKGYRRIYTSGDITVKSVEELVAALKAAKPGQVVYIPEGARIDLTETETLAIPEGVTLAGSRGAGESVGALLVSKRKKGLMFSTAGDGVRLTGLRFEGAYAGPERVAVDSRFLSVAHYGCEVDNCEVYSFNLSGVGVSANAMGAHIHHNDMHHIQLGGYGYAVSTSASDVRIIANRFDYGRHFIASSGTPGSGYEAAYNLVGPNATSHHFDMHGGRDRGDSTDIAGDWMHIHHNTFLGKHRHVVIRGVPCQGAQVHHNWFSGPASEKVVSGGNTRVYRNVYGPEKTLEE